MVAMQTLLTGSILPDWRSCTLYSSVNLRPSPGTVKPWNSRSVCRPRLLRSTRNSTRWAPAYLMSRYTWLQAMNVLPLPVAICTRERGRASASDCSKLRMACACTVQRLESSSGGIVVNLRRRLYGAV